MLRLKYLLRLCVFAAMAFALAPYMSAKEKNNEYIVVIDAGHGGKDAGAVDNNVKEKDINLGVALKLGKMISKNLKNVKVVYTRDDDTFVSLQERAEKSNKAKADLFISIHTNSVDRKNPNRRSIAGASVYALGLHKDEDNLEVAMRENSVIELEQGYEEKYSGFDPTSDESYIIFEMTQKKKLENSLAFARDVQKNLVKEAGRADRGVHQAGFWVLWATSAPAVLVELDFICNPNSAKYIASSAGQEKLAQGIYKSVEEFVKRKSLALTQGEDEEMMADESGEDSAVLPSSRGRRAERADRVPTSEALEQKNVATRRRRSEKARIASNNRDVEVAQVPETIVETGSENVSKTEEATIVSSVAASKAESENTKHTAQNLPVAKKPITSPAKNSERTARRHSASLQRITTVYRIQLVVSDTELKEDNPIFAGLSPLTLFKEHGLYKYTYGEGASKKELEPLLRSVQEKVPEARIIKCIK